MSNLTNNFGQFCRRNETVLWLTLIVLFGAILRIKGLTFQSYWYDELFSASLSNPARSFFEIIELSLADVHPPFFQLAMWGSYKVFGYTEWAGRFPSMLAGILTLPAIFILGQELFSKRVGLYAAALAAPNYYFIYFSQEARSYTFLCLFCCMSFFYFMRVLRDAVWNNVALYIFFTTLLLYTHYFGFVLLVAQGAAFVVYLVSGHLNDRKLLVRAAVSVGVVIAAVLPLVPAMLGHAEIAEFWIIQPEIIAAINYFLAYFSLIWIGYLFAALIAVALTVGVYRVNCSSDAAWVRYSIIALLLWIVIGFLLPWARGLIGQPVITNRNTIMLIPPILLLSAYGLSSVSGLLVQRLVGAAIIAVSVVYLIGGFDYYNRVTKNQYREMALSLSAYSSTLPVYTLNINDTKYNVYFEQLDSELRAADASVLEQKLEAGTAEPLFWIADGHRRAFETDIEERFGLVQVARYRHHTTAAELLVNPARATAIEMEPAMITTADGNWHSAGPVVWLNDDDQLLIALNESARTDPGRRVQVDLLDRAGRVLETHAAILGAMPSTMQFDPGVPAGEKVRLLIRLPENEPEPQVWKISGDAG